MIDRGKKAIELLTNLKRFVTPIVEKTGLQRAQGDFHPSYLVRIADCLTAWKQLFLPLLSSLSRQSTNAAREVRQAAISQLQRTLLAPHPVLDEADSEQVEELFNRVVFPLLDELLRPQVFQRDPQGMVETRLRASALLSKTFMHFEVRESQAQADIRIQWIEVLDLLDRFMNISKSDQLVRSFLAS